MTVLISTREPTWSKNRVEEFPAGVARVTFGGTMTTNPEWNAFLFSVAFEEEVESIVRDECVVSLDDDLPSTPSLSS